MTVISPNEVSLRDHSALFYKLIRSRAGDLARLADEYLADRVALIKAAVGGYYKDAYRSSGLTQKQFARSVGWADRNGLTEAIKNGSLDKLEEVELLYGHLVEPPSVVDLKVTSFLKLVRRLRAFDPRSRRFAFDRPAFEWTRRCLRDEGFLRAQEPPPNTLRLRELMERIKAQVQPAIRRLTEHMLYEQRDDGRENLYTLEDLLELLFEWGPSYLAACEFHSY